MRFGNTLFWCVFSILSNQCTLMNLCLVALFWSKHLKLRASCLIFLLRLKFKLCRQQLMYLLGCFFIQPVFTGVVAGAFKQGKYFSTTR